MKKPSLMPIILVSILLVLIFTAAAQAQPDGADGIMNKFVGRTSGWWEIMRGEALKLFKLTAIIEVCLFGIRMVLEKSQPEAVIGQFVMTLVYMTFIWMVIQNYEAWAQAVAINGLKPLAATLGGGGEPFDVGMPSAIIFKIVDSIAPVMKDAGWRDFGMMMIYAISMAAIVAVFAIICLDYILAVCEFHFCANVGLLLIGLGGSKLFKEYAVNVMKYILSVGLKLFVLTLILTIGFSILQLQDMTTQAGAAKTIKNINIVDLVLLIFQGIILLGLAKSLPQTCAGLLSGASIGGGNPLQSMAKAAGGAALGAATGGAGMALKAAGNAGLAFMAAGAGPDGKKGLARIGQAAKDFGGAMLHSAINKNPNSMMSQLNSLRKARKNPGENT